MATISSSKFSFIRFENLEAAYCHEEADYILPAWLKHEVKFQFNVDGDLSDAEKIKLGTNGIPFLPAVYAQVLDYKFKVDVPVDITLPFFVSQILFGAQVITYNRNFTADEFLQTLLDDFGIVAYFDATYLRFVWSCKQCFVVLSTQGEVSYIWSSVEYFWNRGYVEAPDVDVTEDCFRYTLSKEDDVDDVPLGSSNQFNKLLDDCYSSLLTYSCNENSFEFIYAGGQVNRVRLPFYLSRPTHPTKREVYIKSNGLHKTLSAFVEKEYNLQTDWMIELFHECMAIALAHDTITLYNTNTREKSLAVLASDNYTPEWNTDFELAKAPAKGKLKVSSFGLTNSNCETEADDCVPCGGGGGGGGEGGCGDPDNLVITDITTTGAHAAWDAVAGSSGYLISIQTTGEPPISPDGYPRLVLGNSYDFPDLIPGEEWTWKVKSICAGTESAWVVGPNFTTLV